ncbi:hypothetical protein SAHY_15832 [Salinisphaera hydrothermalis EPR70]
MLGCMALVVVACATFGLHSGYFDVSEYAKLVRFDFSDVTQPYASRVLGPFIAHYFVTVFGLSPLTAIAAVSLASLVMLTLVWTHYSLRSDVSLPIAALAFVVPYLASVVKFIYVPDALALLTCFLTLYACKCGYLSGGIIAGSLSLLARKSLVVPYVLLATLRLVRKRPRQTLLLGGAIVLGLLSLHFAVPPNMGNVHHMSVMSYYLLKLPANFITNLLGINLYTNTYQWCHDPVRIFDVSGFPGLGHINKIGYCALDVGRITTTYAVYILIFGAWPILAFDFLRHRWRDGDADYILLFIVFFTIAPCLGRSVSRLFLYAECFYLISIPALVTYGQTKKYWGWFIGATGTLQVIGLGALILGYLQPG